MTDKKTRIPQEEVDAARIELFSKLLAKTTLGEGERAEVMNKLRLVYHMPGREAVNTAQLDLFS